MKVVLRVSHEGVAKMTGKLFPLADGTHVFLHEESGTQRHFKTGSPGGVDGVVVDFLVKLSEKIGPINIHHRAGRHNPVVLWASPTRLQECGETYDWDGRSRYFLPMEYWAEKFIDYEIPWITQEATLV